MCLIAASDWEQMWSDNAELTERVGEDTRALGERLRAAEQLGAGVEPALALAVGRALKRYLDALQAECFELQECLAWKHWYREAAEGRQYELMDVQNARVEVIDALFFWISLAQLVGLRPADVRRLYAQKRALVERRLDAQRTQREHPLHHAENRAIS